MLLVSWTDGLGRLAEVHKVPEPANLVRRKYLNISLLAENFDQNPRVESTETFLSQVQFIITENLLYTLFSGRPTHSTQTQYSCR